MKKKEVYLVILILIILFLLTAESIKAINVTSENITEKITSKNITIEITGKSITAETLTGESVTGEATQAVSMNITVTNNPPNITSYYPVNLNLSVSGTDSLYFNITVYDPSGTVPNTFWYADGSLRESDSYVFNEFTYSFGCGASGNHTIKVLVTDSIEPKLNVSVQWNINVSYVACPAPLPGVGGGGAAEEIKVVSRCYGEANCSEWVNCYNLKKSREAGIISENYFESIKKECSKNDWSEIYCGFQIRSCSFYNSCNKTTETRAELQECYYTEAPSCYDGIKNCHDRACEEKIDCGGPCLACSTCYDKKQNQGEEGIDCGGPCPKSCPLELPTLIKLPLKYFLIIIIIILLIFIIYVLARVIKVKKQIKKIKEIKKTKLYYLSFIIFILIAMFFYLYTKFEIGDFVYKIHKENIFIGEIKNKSLLLKPLVKWQDNSESEEYLFNIRKLRYLTEEEIKSALQTNNNLGLSLFSWDTKGEAADWRMPIKNIKELRNYTIKITEKDCRPSFICGSWSKCKVDYNFDKLYEKRTFGIKYRYCIDYVECMSDFIYSEKCEIKEPITILAKEKENYFELYTQENKLIAKLTRKIIKGIKKLDIEIVVG